VRFYTCTVASSAEQESLIEQPEAAEYPANAAAIPGGEPAPEFVPGSVLVEPAAPSSNQLNELNKETLLPVTGMVRLSRRELRVIDHPAFQRLFEIYQLGLAYLVYRGATHMRGEHAIGTLEEATKLAEASRRNAGSADVTPGNDWQPAEPLSNVELSFVRLAALLHDVGHISAGHTLEDELGLLSHHDADARIEMVLDKTTWHERPYRPLRELIDELYGADAAAAGQRDPSGELRSASQLLLLLISRDHKDAEASPDTALRIGVCRDIVGNTICADLLDYLHRDLLHLGKPRIFDPRLLEYIEIRTRLVVGRRHDRVVINLRGTPRPRPDAITAILDLLEARYQLAEIALFHRVKNSASGMLERAIAELRDTFPVADQADALAALTSRLLECSDLEMLALFESELASRRNRPNARRVDGAIDLLRRVRVRQLHRDLEILYEDDVGGPEAVRVIVERFSEHPDLKGEEARQALRDAADSRLLALRTLEQDFGLDPGSIVMYCPSPKMNTKLAEVGIYYNGVVNSLANLDIGGRLTGGHLDAQQRRFRRLWRISFAIDRDAYDKLNNNGSLELLREAIRGVVLRQPAYEAKPVEDVVRAIAQDLIGLDGSPWHGRQLVEPALNREQPDFGYPGDAPSIRSFIGEKASAKSTRR